MAVPATKKACTLADFLAWDESERAEIVRGEAVMMASPSRVHQSISMSLAAQLYNFLEGKSCKVYPAPFAVRLFERAEDAPKDVDTVVEPDISVVCDKSKLDDWGCKGAPDMVIEILSPSTQRHDRLVKMNLYQQAGVREYWIVNPADKTVQTYLLADGFLRPHESYSADAVAKVQVLNGCFIELSRIFTE